MLGLAAEAAAPSLTLYEVTAPLLVVILLTGVLGETRLFRERRDDSGSDEPTPAPPVSKWERRSMYGLGAVMLMVLLGEGVSLHVLADPPAEDWQRVTVIACSALGLGVVCGLNFLPVLLHVMTPRAKARVVPAVNAVLLLAAASGCAYAVLGALDRSEQRSYRVYGTCAEGRCGLNVRSRPTSHAFQRGQLRDGDEVTIACQTVGERLETRNRISSRIWNRLASGGYISDLYVDTERAGRFSPDLPGCGDAAGRETPTG